jgi:selenocysteine-specific elongation factor
VALAGVDHDEVSRGAVLVADAGWQTTRVLRADVGLIASGNASSLSPRANVRFHLGTTEVGARIVTPGGPLSPGETKPARVVLDAPIVVRAGDRFVIRGGSPLGTLGGGVVADPSPSHRRPRPWTTPHESVADRLALALHEAGRDGLEVASVPVRVGVRPHDVDGLLDQLNALRIGGRVFDGSLRNGLVASVEQIVADHHARAPLDVGLALQTVRAQIKGRSELVDYAMRDAVDARRIEIDGGLIRKAGWTPQLSAAQSASRDRLIASIRAAGNEPPSVAELEADHGPSSVALLRLLEREEVIIPVESDRYYSKEAVSGLVERLRGSMQRGREYSPAELRDAIGLSRKFLIPFLEYCDRSGVTERRSTGRVLHGT